MNQNEQNIREVVDAVMRQMGLQAGYDRISAYEAWEDVVGAMIAKHTKRLSLKDGVLFVKLDSSVVRHEVAMAKGKIAADINAHLGKELVKDVVVL